MLKRLDPAQATLRLYFEGQPILASPGDTVAAALLAGGAGPFRTTPASGAPRAAHCMMGVCFECLVEIDGVPNRQACLTEAVEGMRVRRQNGARGMA
jgi:predicted molibdopterin-dependent oxidoreductase YjgC